MRPRGTIYRFGIADDGPTMDAVMRRIDEHQSAPLAEALHGTGEDVSWRVAVAPHDDYTNVGYLYPAVLGNVRAKTIIFFGVAHKARNLGLENELIFDSYSHWTGPYGPVAVSPLRDEIMRELPSDLYQVNDAMHDIEHSIEAIVPFLQHDNRDVRIVPILVPAMPFDRMEHIAKLLAGIIGTIAAKQGLRWGEEYSIVISTDAVHYGDEGWSGCNFARFGADETGYRAALAHEEAIIDNCLRDEIEPHRLKAFTEYTVSPLDFREYIWTWCGRYSLPFGLLTAYHLQRYLNEPPLSGKLLGYRTSIDSLGPLPLDDLGLRATNPATIRHWVGYPALGYV